MLSREAFRLFTRSMRRVFEDPSDLSARADVLLGAALAGMAIENSMLGAAHAAANPLTARFGVVHGHAVGMMLPSVVRFNSQDPEVASLYQQLALQSGLMDDCGTNGTTGGDRIAKFLTSFRKKAGLPESLLGFNLSDTDIGLLAEDAAKQWTGTFNPRLVGVNEFVRLYQAALTENEGITSR